MRRRAGFTIVELLVVIAIIGVLVALLLPAVQFARESARRTQCLNNLKQVGLAAIQHENAQRHYANRTDSNVRQGTWITAILPYMEEENLFNAWSNAVGYRTKGVPAAGAQPIREILAIPVATLYCPSRRPVAAYPSLREGLTAHTDYALNGGASSRPDEFKVKWPGIWAPSTQGTQPKPVRYRDVVDGLSKTYLAGEKALSTDQYLTGLDRGDDGSIHDCPRGNCVRFAKRVPAHDVLGRENCWNCHSFGSAHPTSWNAVFCDGSVHSVSYEISFAAHAAQASRAARDRGDVLQ
jgi:prepilin-type N-terminal cleavage/methylation domain-containing protein